VAENYYLVQAPEPRFDDITKLASMVFKVGDPAAITHGKIDLRCTRFVVLESDTTDAGPAAEKSNVPCSLAVHQAVRSTSLVLLLLLQVPIALVSLVDEKIQWFKSVQGLPVDNTPRNTSFCAWYVMSCATASQKHMPGTYCAAPFLHLTASGSQLERMNFEKVYFIIVMLG